MTSSQHPNTPKGQSVGRWTIAVITAWDGEEGDELYDNVAVVEAASAEEAERIYGEEHPHERDYDFIYARPEGTPW